LAVGYPAADRHPAGDLLAMKSRLVWQAPGKQSRSSGFHRAAF
jgi:hypothetical protein